MPRIGGGGKGVPLVRLILPFHQPIVLCRWFERKRESESVHMKRRGSVWGCVRVQTRRKIIELFRIV